jgi:hypothetical protein
MIHRFSILSNRSDFRTRTRTFNIIAPQLSPPLSLSQTFNHNWCHVSPRSPHHPSFPFPSDPIQFNTIFSTAIPQHNYKHKYEYAILISEGTYIPPEQLIYHPLHVVFLRIPLSNPVQSHWLQYGDGGEASADGPQPSRGCRRCFRRRRWCALEFGFSIGWEYASQCEGRVG